METDLLGKTCFKMYLSSKIGITVLTTELTSIVAFSSYHVLTNSIALFFFLNTQPTISLDLLIGMAIDRNLALETLYDGQFTLKTQLIKSSYAAKE